MLSRHSLARLPQLTRLNRPRLWVNTCAPRRTGCSLARIIVYDLGFEECQRAQLANRSDITLRPFEFSRFPPHFDLTVAAGQYAWKPAIVKEVVLERCWSAARARVAG